MASEEIKNERKQIDSQERAVLYSNNLLKAFDLKAETFNSSHERKVTPSQIKSIYLNAVSEETSPQVKNLYAFARINLFFDMIIGEEGFITGKCAQGEEKNNEVTGLQFEFIDLRETNRRQDVETAIDFFEGNFIAEKHYSKAKEDLVNFDIDFDLFSVEEELFLIKKEANVVNNYLWEIL